MLRQHADFNRTAPVIYREQSEIGGIFPVTEIAQAAISRAAILKRRQMVGYDEHDSIRVKPVHLLQIPGKRLAAVVDLIDDDRMVRPAGSG